MNFFILKFMYFSGALLCGVYLLFLLSTWLNSWLDDQNKTCNRLNHHLAKTSTSIPV
jgi:hypothetical protein